MSRIVALPEMWGNSLLTEVAGLHSIRYKAIKNKLLTKLLKDILKVLENLQEKVCNEVLF